MKILISAALFIISYQSVGQMFDNGSFERWSNINGVQTPEGWTVSQELNCNPVSSAKVTDKVDSSFALYLETSNCTFAGGLHEGYARGFYKVTSTPKWLNGYYKSVRVNNDSSVIMIILKNGNETIGGGALFIYQTISNYTQFSIPIENFGSTVATDIEINIQTDRNIKSVLGNKLWVDGLSLSDFATGVQELNKNRSLNIQIQPNPVKDFLTIVNSSGLSQQTQYVVLDMLGKTLLSGNITGEKTSVDMTECKEGIYIIKVENGLGSYQTKLIRSQY